MKVLIPLFSLAFLLSACGLSGDVSSGPNGPQTIALIGPNEEAISLVVDVADDPAERAKGLMGRPSLEEDHGMLFLFPEAEPLTFWMKDTLMPLDIIFFDPQGKVIGSDSMVPCEEDPCLQYTSSGPANIALEVNAGFVEKHSIGEGWQLALPIQN